MKKRFLSIAVVVLLFVLICGIAQHDNDRMEEAMEVYLNKIWIASDWTGEYYDEISFCFLEIEDGKCQGGLEPDRVCNINKCFQIEEGNLIWNSNNVFSGIIRGNTAECQFTDRRNRTGSMMMTFLNANEIEVTIRYVSRGKVILETKTYRPYNISDMKNFTLQEEQPLRGELDPEGKVYIAAGVHHWTNGLAFLRDEPYAEAYLVNENRDVLDIIEFKAEYHVGVKIDDIIINDANEDGLEDVVISTCFVENDMEMEGMPHIHWLFLQSDMGMFEWNSIWVAEEDSILRKYPDAEEGTWEREYQNCVRTMEFRINENLPSSDREINQCIALWYDTLNMFCKFISTSVGYQSENTGSGEEVYRTAVLLMTEMRDRRGSSYEPYEFLSSHGEDVEKAREEFRAVVKGENPIDEAITMFHKKFDSVYYVAYDVSELGAKKWEEEFYHCLELVKASAGQAGVEKEENVLEILKAYEAFFAFWADKEQIRAEFEGGSGLRGWIGVKRAEVFRIGTMLLIDAYERAGGSYAFLYDSEADRQMLTESCFEYLHTDSVMSEDLLSWGDEDPDNSVPAELVQTLSAALQNDAIEACMADLSAKYVLLEEDEVMQCIWEDTSWILESFYRDHIEGGEEWFLFARDNDIIVRQESDDEDYLYCYYIFPCEGDGYGAALCAYGKDEDCFFISWEDEDYLAVTKRAEGPIQGIAVYNMNMSDDNATGWILGLEKRPDGEIEVTYKVGKRDFRE